MVLVFRGPAATSLCRSCSALADGDLLDHDWSLVNDHVFFDDRNAQALSKAHLLEPIQELSDKWFGRSILRRVPSSSFDRTRGVRIF